MPRYKLIAPDMLSQDSRAIWVMSDMVTNDVVCRYDPDGRRVEAPDLSAALLFMNLIEMKRTNL